MLQPPTTPRARPTVLVCDDEPVLRMLVRATLDQGNYTVVEACDGDEALARTRSDHPDLILLDMMMPGRSGSDVLRELRRGSGHGRDARDHADRARTGLRPRGDESRRRRTTTSRSRSARSGSPPWSKRCWARERVAARAPDEQGAESEAPENRSNASLERENTALGLESDELKAQQVTMEAQQVTMGPIRSRCRRTRSRSSAWWTSTARCWTRASTASAWSTSKAAPCSPTP